MTTLARRLPAQTSAAGRYCDSFLVRLGKATRSSAPPQFLESFPSRRRPSRRSCTRGPTRSTTPTPTFPGGSTSGRRCVRSRAEPSARKCLPTQIRPTLLSSLRCFIPRTASTTLWCWTSFSNRCVHMTETSISNFSVSCHRPDLIFFFPVQAAKTLATLHSSLPPSLPQIVNDTLSEACVRITQDERQKMKALFGSLSVLR